MRNFKRTIQRGFTMVELIIVIVILGILAAAATIGYDSLQRGAVQGQLDGLSSQLTSLAAADYGASIPNSGVAGTDFTSITACNSLIGTGPYQMTLPTGYSLATTDMSASAVGDTVDCTLTYTDTSQTATAKMIRTRT